MPKKRLTFLEKELHSLYDFLEHQGIIHHTNKSRVHVFERTKGIISKYLAIILVFTIFVFFGLYKFPITSYVTLRNMGEASNFLRFIGIIFLMAVILILSNRKYLK